MNIDESTRMVQNCDFRMEIRPETQIVPAQSLDPTTYMEIVVETIDRSDMIEKIVGYAYFPLFLGRDAGNSPAHPGVDQFLFHEGAYQLPVHYARVPLGQVID